MRTSERRAALALCLGILASVALPGPGGDASAEPIFALNATNQISRIDSATPGTFATTITVTGLQPSESLLAMDFRPVDNVLYALGSTSRLYSINLTTGAATAIGGAPFSPALTGTIAGFDFNPVVDRIRIVTDADQNLRIDPTTGAVAGTDTPLAYGAGDPNASANPTIGCAAYTNNFVGSTTTTLLSVDTALDIIAAIGSPAGAPLSPNTGTLTTVGSVGINSDVDCGLDVSGFSGQVYGSFTTPGTNTTSLYVHNLGTGVPLTKLGTIGSAGQTIRDIAVPFTDLTAPAVTLNLNANRVTTNRATIRIIGSATDNVGVQSVQYRVSRNGKGSFTTVPGPNFSFTARLNPGTNRIEVKAVDLYGNESAVIQRTVIRRGR